jgi:hypothetical protein
MTDTHADSDIERLAPQKLMGPFSSGKVLLCIVIAVLIHIVVIGAFSTTYIYYHWINPEAGKALEEAEKRETAEAAGEGAVATTVSGDETDKDETSTEDGDFEQRLEARKDAPVVKEGTRVADPNEIPKGPDSAGISVEETNK